MRKMNRGKIRRRKRRYMRMRGRMRKRMTIMAENIRRLATDRW
jgi:hypothetical protein